MSSKKKSRLIGLGFGLMGNGLMYIAWYGATNHGEFSAKAAICGPFFLAFGVYAMIEAPQFPVNRPSVFGWVMIIAGGVLGFLYAEWLRG